MTVQDRDRNGISSTLNCILAGYQTKDEKCRHIHFHVWAGNATVYFNYLAALYDVRQKSEICSTQNAFFLLISF